MSLEGNVGAAEVLRGRINLCDLLVISAYAIAVKHGFEGTEEEWLESLRGEDGISSIYILDEGESLENVPEESAIVIDPFGEGGAGDGITLLLDETLTLKGYAADAKAVGDTLGSIDVGLPKPQSAQVGQYLRVKAVDENGIVTAVESVDISSQQEQQTYRYNTLELPALPVWDRDAYPYACIVTQQSSTVYKFAFLWCLDHPVFYDSNTYKWTCEPGTGYCSFRHSMKLVDGQWVCGDNGWVDYAAPGIISNGYLGDLNPTLEFNPNVFVWANHNVGASLTDATLYMHGSDPVRLGSDFSLTRVVLLTELTLDGSETELSEEDVTRIEAVAGEPCILQFPLNDGQEAGNVYISGMASWFRMNNLYSGGVTVPLPGGLVSVRVTNNSGSWTVRCTSPEEA